MHVISLIYNWTCVSIIKSLFMAIIFNVLILMQLTSISGISMEILYSIIPNIAFHFLKLKLFYVNDCRNICSVNLKSNPSWQCWQICCSVAILMQLMHYLGRAVTAAYMLDWLCFKLILMSSDQCKLPCL